MTQTIEEKNKAFVLEAFETLFNKRDYAAAQRFWSPNYIQHSAHIPPGREGLFVLVKGTPASLHYENGLTVANGDYVLLHGRFTGMGLPTNWIVVDIVRLENGQLAEHWDVIEDEATKEASVSGLPHVRDDISLGMIWCGVRVVVLHRQRQSVRATARPFGFIGGRERLEIGSTGDRPRRGRPRP